MSTPSCSIQTSSIVQLLFYRGDLYCDSIDQLVEQDHASAMISTHTWLHLRHCHSNHVSYIMFTQMNWADPLIFIHWDFTDNDEDRWKWEWANSGHWYFCIVQRGLNEQLHMWIKSFPHTSSIFYDSVRLAELGESSQIRRAAPAVLSQVSRWGCRLPRPLKTWSAPAAKEWLFTERRAAPVAICFPLSYLLPQSFSCFQHV